MNRFLQLSFSILKLISLPLFNFLVLFFGIKWYGKENWGTFLSLSIWIYLFAFLAKWSGQNYLIKELTKNTSNYLSVFYSNLLERSVLLLPSLALFAFYPITISVYSILALILIFIYNSYEILVVYKQKLELQFIAEIVGMIILFVGFYFLPHFELSMILILFCLSLLIKNLILIGFLKLNFKSVSLNILYQNLYKTVPFFLIGFSGWLASKCDIYVVNYFFSKKELSEYQILMSCFVILQAIPTYLILPINKHLFRLSNASINKTKNKISFWALPIVLFISLFIWIIITYFIQIHFSLMIYIFASLSCIPPFFYTVEVMKLYKENKEKTIMTSCFILFITSFTLMLLLIPRFKILGVVVAVCIAQWLYLFFIYKIISCEK